MTQTTVWEETYVGDAGPPCTTSSTERSKVGKEESSRFELTFTTNCTALHPGQSTTFFRLRPPEFWVQVWKTIDIHPLLSSKSGLGTRELVSKRVSGGTPTVRFGISSYCQNHTYMYRETKGIVIHVTKMRTGHLECVYASLDSDSDSDLRVSINTF